MSAEVDYHRVHRERGIGDQIKSEQALITALVPAIKQLESQIAQKSELVSQMRALVEESEKTITELQALLMNCR